MLKVTLCIGAVLVLANAAVIKTSVDSNIKQGCQSETEIWGSPDGKKFFLCIGNNQSYEDACPPDTFFVSNVTVSGCIPFGLITDKCIYHTEPPQCKGIALLQPQPHTDPTKFYFCTKKGTEPHVGDCRNNTAFINQNGWLGCLEWSNWRPQRGCNFTD